MFAHFWTRSAELLRRGTALLPGSSVALLAVACGLLVASCSSASQPVSLAGPDPADPKVRVPAATYRPLIAPYAAQRPVEPLPWREQNQGVAPAAKP